MNNIQNYAMDQTPIEIALGIDENGRTTAKKLYAFLELNPSNYSKWYKRNILENEFAEEGVDYYSYQSTSEGKGNFAEDFKLTATFAKKLSMKGNGKKAEQARNYFVGIEDTMKLVAKSKQNTPKPQLPSVNMAARIMKGVYKEAGVDPLYIAVAINNLYKKEAGIDFGVPLITDETMPKLYDCTEIAKELGITSKSGKLHIQAVSAIIQHLDIKDNEMVITAFSQNGHDDTTVQYKPSVFDKVKEWIIDNKYPTVISGHGKNYTVTYKVVEVA